MKLRNTLKLKLGTAAFVALAGCTGPVGTPLEMPAIAAPAPVPVPAGPALWKVADADTTIYLFGTVHVLPETGDWYEGRVATALGASQSIVTELPTAALTGPEAQKVIVEKAMLPADKSLRALLSPEQKATYEAALAKLKMPPEALDRFEPWFAAMTLSLMPLLQNGFKAENGVEKVLESKAGAGIERGAVETLDGQMRLFDELPMDAQVAYLVTTSEKIDEVVPTLSQMVAAWKAGDADALAKLMNDSLAGEPELADRLLYARNRAWAEWIDTRLDSPGTVFMAVGAGHLAGDQSVQDALAKRGIASTRVQ